MESIQSLGIVFALVREWYLHRLGEQKQHKSHQCVKHTHTTTGEREKHDGTFGECTNASNAHDTQSINSTNRNPAAVKFFSLFLFFSEFISSLASPSLALVASFSLYQSLCFSHYLLCHSLGMGLHFCVFNWFMQLNKFLCMHLSQFNN